MPPIPQIAAFLQRANLPILCLDTCAILDIVRAPKRLSVAEFEAVMKIHEAASCRPVRLHLVRSSLVQKEFDDNVSEASRECSAAFGVVESYMGQVSLLQSPTLTPISSNSIKLFRKVADDFLGQSLTIDEDDACKLKAANRAIANRAPARHASQSTKDCLVTEEYISLASHLNNQCAVVFISSDSDYLENKSLHPDLQAEFGTVSLLFCKNWQHAKHCLGI